MMKTLFALVSLLFALSSMACPNLEGHFKACQSSVQNTGLFHKVKRITQEKVDGEMIYAITFADTPVTERTEFFIADGRPHYVESAQRLGTKNVRTSTVNCVDNQIELRVVRELVSPLGRMTLNEDVSRLTIKSGILTNHLNYKSPGVSGETIVICQ